jgi:hypothetical protein
MISMTTVEILIPYSTPPTEQSAMALSSAKDVYGIRRLSFDRAARTLRVEYDATRLSPADVTRLVREAGLVVNSSIAPEIPDPLLPPASQPAFAA